MANLQDVCFALSGKHFFQGNPNFTRCVDTNYMGTNDSGDYGDNDTQDEFVLANPDFVVEIGN